LVEGDLVGLGSSGLAGLIVFKKVRGDFAEVLGGAGLAAGVGEGDAVDGAIAAHAWDAAEEGVAGDLAGDGAAIQLEDDAMAGDETEVIGIREAVFDDLRVYETGGLDAFAAGAAIFVDHGHGRAEAGGDEQRGGVVAGGGGPLAGADEDAGALREREGEVPVSRIDGIGGWDEMGVLAAGGGVDGDQVRGAGETGVSEGANFAEESEIFGVAQELCDLVETAFF